MPKSPDRRQQNERSAGERKVTGARRGRSTPSPGAGSRSPAPTAWLAYAARGSRPPGPRQRPECRLRRSLAAGRPRGRRSSITGRDRTQRLRSSSRPGRWTGRPGGRPRSRRAGTPGERLGHGVDPSSEAAASQARSQPNPGQSQSVSTGTVGHLERCDGDHPRGSRPSSSRCDATSPTSTTGCASREGRAASTQSDHARGATGGSGDHLLPNTGGNEFHPSRPVVRGPAVRPRRLAHRPP
jgi:hypothetical protein